MEDGEKVKMLGHKKRSMKHDRQTAVASKCVVMQEGDPLVFESQLSTLPVLQLT